jgi:hypothetical protein
MIKIYSNKEGNLKYGVLDSLFVLFAILNILGVIVEVFIDK